MPPIPTLAMRSGRYVEHPPILALHRHFRCAWTHRIADHATTEIAVVPDGCVDLIWREGRLLAVGPDIVAARPQLAAGETIIGLRFQPGMATAWLGLPMHEIVGLAVDMRDLWGQRVQPIIDRLQAAPLSQQSALLQNLMVPFAQQHSMPVPDAALIFQSLQQSSREEGVVLRPLLSKLGTSERTLRRRSHHLFGYGLKTLERILRFQHFARLAGTSRHEGLADLAAAAGYADQAHLSREIRALCSMSASEFQRQMRASPVA